MFSLVLHCTLPCSIFPIPGTNLISYVNLDRSSFHISIRTQKRTRQKLIQPHITTSMKLSSLILIFSNIHPVANLKCFCFRIEPIPAHTRFHHFFSIQGHAPAIVPSFYKINFALLMMSIKKSLDSLSHLSSYLIHSSLLFTAIIAA